MKNKYYTPQIEEFSIGVECQVYHSKEKVWKDIGIRHGEDLTKIVSTFTTDNTSVRFKYLDEDDLFKTGFQFLDSREGKLRFINERDEKIYFGDFYKELRYIVIENNCGQFYFMGWLKNKNELQKVLKQVGI